MKKYILATFALIAMCFSAMAAKPNNAFQLNYKNETVAPLQARLLGNPRFVFSEDGSEITFYKGANPANMVIKVDSVNSLAYIYMPHVHNNITLVADTVMPTDETTGTLAYWECLGTAEDPSCTLYFADSLGTQEIGNDSLLNIWLAKGGKGYLKCVYDSAYFYAVVNDTLIVRADRIAELKNETRDTVDYFVMSYTRLGEPQTYEAEAVSMDKVEFKTGDKLATTPVLGVYTYTDNNGTHEITLYVNTNDATDYIIKCPAGLPDGSLWHATFDAETNTLICAGVEVGFESYGNQFGFGISYGWYNKANLYTYGYVSYMESLSEDGTAPLVFNLDDDGYMTGIKNGLFGAFVYQADAQGTPQGALGWGYLINNSYEFSYKGAANAPMRSNAGNADAKALKAVKAVKASLIDKKELVEMKNIGFAY